MQNKILFFSLSIVFFFVACKTPIPESGTTKSLSNIEEAPFVNHYSNALDKLYRLDTIITISGRLKKDKSGLHVNGVYLDKDPEMEGFIKIKGTLKRVQYPLAYYSTDAAPQGMFSDTTVKHYRLFLEPISIQNLTDH